VALTPFTLEKDSDLAFPLFTLLKASAGSGKTHALTKRFVQFLLSTRVPHNGLNNILAITFSNNAAREMKERILTWLKAAYLGEAGTLEELCEVLSLSPEGVSQRAGERIDEILDSYADFQVRTIDSFMATLFKASAIDFGYSPDFDILMSPDRIMGYAFSLFLRRVREGSGEAGFIGEMVDRVLENRPGDLPYPWDPSTEILAEIRGIHRKLAVRGGDLETGDIQPAIEEVRGKLIDAVGGMKELIEKSGLKPSKGSSYERIAMAVRGSRFSDLLGRGTKLPPVLKPDKESLMGQYDAVVSRWRDICGLLSEHALLYAFSYYLPYVRVYGAFEETLEAAKKREGKVFIDDVNRKLAQSMTAELVPDVYFRMADTVFHYLIDEFQDTSPIQWTNLTPLLENSCAQGGSVFVVGDTKQAIYGFRDADYHIMKGCEEKNPFPSSNYTVGELGLNYRSLPQIVDFGCKVFQGIEQNSVHGEAARQSGLLDYVQATRESPGHTGYVEYVRYERDDEHPPERAKICTLVRDLAARGYKYKDMAVLTGKNDDVIRVSSWLNEESIPFLSYSSLDIRRRKITGELISLLRFLNSPIDDLSFAGFILGDMLRRVVERDGEGEDRSRLLEICFRNRGAKRPLYKVFQEACPSLWQKYFEVLFRLSGYLPLYDLVDAALKTFDVFRTFGEEEEATLSKILEVVSEFESQGSNSIHNFLLSAEEEDEQNWDLAAPQGIDAVRVMTVHKAKGLGFPVVILLLYGERGKGFKYVVWESEGEARLLKVTRSLAGDHPQLGQLYDREELGQTVNRLNTLYVGLSRAASELYVVGVGRERDGFPFELLPSESPSTFGTITSPSPEDEETPEGIDLRHAKWRHEPVHEPKGLQGGRAERKRGDFFHRIFFVLGKAGSVENLDDHIIRAGEEEGVDYNLDEARALIMGLLEEGKLPFGPGWHRAHSLKVEAPYCDEKGSLFRMDCVAVTDDSVTVYDYKTGTGKGSEELYMGQVTNYMRILQSIYPEKRLEGVIVYIDSGRVERVGLSR